MVFRNKVLLLRISGALVIAMALFLLGSLVLKLPGLYREARFNPDLSKYGPFAAPVAGAAFGFGWTPCLGPILTSVLALAATTGGAVHGGGVAGGRTRSVSGCPSSSWASPSAGWRACSGSCGGTRRASP